MRFAYAPLLLMLAIGEPVAENVPFSKTEPGHDLLQQIVPQQVMVKLRSGTLNKVFIPTTLQAIQKRYGITRIEPVFPDRFPVSGALDWQIFHYADNRDPRELAAALQSLPDIEVAEPRRHYPLVAIPNDSLFSQQIHLAQISAPQAWDIAKAEQGDVVIAIVDGGTALTHPDLQANLWHNPGEIADNGIDDDQNGYTDDIHGWNFANDSGDPSPLPNQPVNGYHGTHVAGLASAVSDNRIGVSGSSWNAKLMIINGSSPTSDRSILNGFAGILYAAANGARVINCSWGAISSPSEYEEWAIEQATAMGAVVVAAAGNDNLDDPHYPSSYDNVFSVTAVTSADIKASLSNYGSTVDAAGPGINLLSTVDRSGYGYATGTSMAAPVAAGVVALVAAKNPDWSGLQCAAQVRATADPIDELNPDFLYQLGKGRVNAWRALTESPPAIQIRARHLRDQNGQAEVDPGDRIELWLDLFNHLAPTADLLVEITAQSPGIAVTNPQIFIGPIDSQGALQAGPFQLDISPVVEKGTFAQLRVKFNANGYSDFDYLTIPIAPLYAISDVNDLCVTLTPVGRIGTPDPALTANGIGVRYKNGFNLLFEGAILSGTGPDRISNAARGILAPQLTYDSDFIVDPEGGIRIQRPGSVADLQSWARFSDAGADKPLEIRITQESFAASDFPFRDFILLRYRIENLGKTLLSNFHFGLFFDWDIGTTNVYNNIAAFDSMRGLGYVFGGDDQLLEYAGVRCLTPGQISYRAIFNDQNEAGNSSWGIYDGFLDEEKWDAISGGSDLHHAGPADVSHCLAVGPYEIAVGDTLDVGFALIGGHSLEDLQNSADAALFFFHQLFDSTDVATPQHDQLLPPYPNPFKRQTVISYRLAQSAAIDLSVYNLLGKQIKSLIKTHKIAGGYTQTWDGRDEQGRRMAAGLYFVRLQVGGKELIHKIILLP